jgi:hypothetical protein
MQEESPEMPASQAEASKTEVSQAEGQVMPTIPRVTVSQEPMPAKTAGKCDTCGEVIDKGAMIWPIERLKKGDKARVIFTWSHVDCARSSDGELPPLPVCKHWARHGTCTYGDKCFYRHDGTLATDIRPVEFTENVRKLNRGKGKRNKIRNSAKSSIFAKWLIETYGIEYLRSGSGVLCIADGKGELAYHLGLSGISATVVDPRPLDLDKCRRQHAAGYEPCPLVHASLFCTDISLLSTAPHSNGISLHSTRA